MKGAHPRAWPLVAAGLCLFWTPSAHAQHTHADPTEKAAAPTEVADKNAHAGHDMHTAPVAPGAHEAMRSALGDYPMQRDASGTSWQPDATPMHGRHFSRGAWGGMLHGYAQAVASSVEGPRGGDDFAVPTMWMAMGQRRLGAGTLGLRAMVSLDPWLVGDEGYRLLLQTGETADGHEPLIDRQHPHDAWMELAATYSRPWGRHGSAYVYVGLPGEPALGPPAFMHRFSGIEGPEAPLGHHWLDATHITYGVATLGAQWRDAKLEVSAFNAREPDQHRTDIETRSLRSWSARVSFNPSPAWALQASHGELHGPEQLEPGVDISRTTASIMHHRALRAHPWQTLLAWGRNRKHPGGSTDAWLLESALASGPTIWFGRIEHVEKDELFDHHDPRHGRAFAVGKLSVGAVRDVARGDWGRLGLGAQFSWHRLPSALESEYGDDPTGWLVFARWAL